MDRVDPQKLLTPLPDDSPLVTIVVPVKPGGAVDALEAIRRLDYPPQRVEVIIACGARPSRQRNLAVERAQGELVYFLDDDSLPLSDALSRIATAMKDPAVAVVGGPSLTPPTDSPFQRSIAAALASPLGGGGVRNRYRSVGGVRPCRDNELILCNLAIRRAIFQDCGGLDERLYPNEENELLDRIRERKMVLVHDPGLVVYRSQRKTIPAFVRQMLTYGRGRGEQTRLTGRVQIPLLLPPLFICYLLSLPLISGRVTLLPLFVYLLLLLGTAAGISVREGVLIGTRVLGVILLTHLLYGSGVVIGLLAPRYCRKVSDGGVEIRIVKELGADWE